MSSWKNCNKLLCIRPDNMGDLIMSGPAIRALKDTFNCHLTVLTSRAGALIAPYIPEIDQVLVANLPWVQQPQSTPPEALLELIQLLRTKQFDGCVIFTVYSQNPLPSAMLAYQAGIPKIAAFCHENPYGLVTDWIPDEEPFGIIRHQVERDLELVRFLGAAPKTDHLQLVFQQSAPESVWRKLDLLGTDISKGYFVIHPGVSEKKREFPKEGWIETGKQLIKHWQLPVFVSGSASEQFLAQEIAQGIGSNCHAVAGNFNIEEFIAFVAHAKAILSVNTASIHIAAAVKTPVLVLYALTNPQHTPWNCRSVVLPFSVPKELRSKNSILSHVSSQFPELPFPDPEHILSALNQLLFQPVDTASRSILHF